MSVKIELENPFGDEPIVVEADSLEAAQKLARKEQRKLVLATRRQEELLKTAEMKAYAEVGHWACRDGHYAHLWFVSKADKLAGHFFFADEQKPYQDFPDEWVRVENNARMYFRSSGIWRPTHVLVRADDTAYAVRCQDGTEYHWWFVAAHKDVVGRASPPSSMQVQIELLANGEVSEVAA